MKKRIAALICSLAVIGILAGCASSAENSANAPAETYPTKTIEVIQGFKAGGGCDAVAQLCDKYSSAILGQTIINTYQPGASGAIAWTQVANKGATDGYTLTIFGTPPIVSNYLLSSDVSYRLSDFVPIANIVTDPGVIAVRAESAFQTLDDFINACKAEPGMISASYSGIGGDDFFAALMLEKACEVELSKIPYDGDASSWQAALGGDVDVTFNNYSNVKPQADAGTMRILGVMSEERLASDPEIPTFRELGYDLISSSSRGYAAPAGISDEVYETLCDCFKQLSTNEDLIADAAERGMTLNFLVGQDYTDYLNDLETQYAALWEEVADIYGNA